MNTTDLVQFPSSEIPHRLAAPRPTLAPSHHELAAPVRSSIFRARHQLIEQQRLDGSWAARTALNSSSLSHLVLLETYLRRAQSDFAEQAACTIQRDQQPAGGWTLAAGGSVDLDTSVLAYFALKLLGENANQPDMCRARQAIRQLGGADACGAATRLWLALLGQIDYEHSVPIAPEWLLMPACTSWLSAADELHLAAYSVVGTLRPRREIEIARGARELFVEPPQHWPKRASYIAANTSTAFTCFWSGCERFSFMPLRKRALGRANFLLTEAAIESGRDDAFVDELTWQLMALDALGHAENSRVVTECERRLQQLANTEADDDRSQPETSLTADTALVIEALVTGGMGIEASPVVAGIGWLAAHRLAPRRRAKQASEVAALLRASKSLREGDTSFDDYLPPRIELAAIASSSSTVQQNWPPAIELTQVDDAHLHECRRHQQPDGGWILEDESVANGRCLGVIRASARRTNAVSEPASTGMMMELLSPRAGEPNSAAIARAVAFIRSSQRGDGSWTCPAGGRFVDSTAWAVRGMIAAGTLPSDPAVDAGLNWLLIHQQPSGGWSEPRNRSTVESESSPDESTAVQTAAVVLALLAAGLADHEATRRGIEFLVHQQNADGAWAKSQSTEQNSIDIGSTCNDLYATAWSLMALARWAVAIGVQAHDNQPTGLRLVCSDAL